MKHTLEAIYKDGVFKPLEPPAIPDGERVKIEVDTPEADSADDLLAMAGAVYRDLAVAEIDEIEKIALDRRDFFDSNGS